MYAARGVDSSHFGGLPATLLVLAFTIVLALLAGIVAALITSAPMVAVDYTVAQWVSAFRAPDLIPPFIWITGLGAVRVVAPLLVVVCIMLWVLRRRWLTLPLLISSVGATASTQIGKLALHRPRPVEAVLIESSWSFPSGHATIAIAFYGFIGYVLIRSVGRGNTRVGRLFLTGLLVSLIGLSRIVLGVHYLSDVAGGYLVGTLWLIIAISLSEWLTTGGLIAWHPAVEASRRRAAIGLMAGALLGYLGFASQWQPPRQVQRQSPTVEVTQVLDEVLREQRLVLTGTSLAKLAPDCLPLFCESSFLTGRQPLSGPPFGDRASDLFPGRPPLRGDQRGPGA